MWILTMEVIAYDQHGEYFISAFDHKPTFEELKRILPDYTNNETISRLVDGGGRHDGEHVWYYLAEVKSGEVSPLISFI